SEERRRRKGLAWLAGSTAALLALVGGGTFALWSASDDFTGGTIIAGDLNIVLDDESWWDTSPDRTDGDTRVPGAPAPGAEIRLPAGMVPVQDLFTGHEVTDLNQWRMVPGDTVLRVINTTVTLSGDNLIAGLYLDIEDLDPEWMHNSHLNWWIAVTVDGELVRANTISFPRQGFVNGELALVYLTPPTYRGDDDATDHWWVIQEGSGWPFDLNHVFGMEDEEADVTFIIGATFRACIPGHPTSVISTEPASATCLPTGPVPHPGAGRNNVGAVDVLADMTINLRQVREHGLFDSGAGAINPINP
ncbi:MAG: SipW-dependent-type signal peptide-containing protein, partial [Promicromonosporaceae bacterium]|nr:SipW-dependent-type signal peptide-containing protein [Promicromonosporaceae bacterium]